MTGLLCPSCDSPRSKVVDSRPWKATLRRRRACEECAHRWYTYEVGFDGGDLAAAADAAEALAVSATYLANALGKMFLARKITGLQKPEEGV